MNVTQYTSQNLCLARFVWIGLAVASIYTPTTLWYHCLMLAFDISQPVRRWLNQIKVRSPKQAHHLCQLIPAQCPIERNVKFLGHTLFRIPPLCKLNPLYEEVVGLRFRALRYLADECGEDVTPYC